MAGGAILGLVGVAALVALAASKKNATPAPGPMPGPGPSPSPSPGPAPTPQPGVATPQPIANLTPAPAIKQTDDTYDYQVKYDNDPAQLLFSAWEPIGAIHTPQQVQAAIDRAYQLASNQVSQQYALAPEYFDNGWRTYLSNYVQQLMPDQGNDLPIHRTPNGQPALMPDPGIDQESLGELYYCLAYEHNLANLATWVVYLRSRGWMQAAQAFAMRLMVLQAVRKALGLPAAPISLPADVIPDGLGPGIPTSYPLTRLPPGFKPGGTPPATVSGGGGGGGGGGESTPGISGEQQGGGVPMGGGVPTGGTANWPLPPRQAPAVATNTQAAKGGVGAAFRGQAPAVMRPVVNPALFRR